jgi:hypothetical protein
MSRRRQAIRQSAVFLVLAILMAATCLPHWHPASSSVPATSSPSTRTHPTVVPLEISVEAEAVDCVLCILQQLLAQARTPNSEVLQRPSVNTPAETTIDGLVSQSPLLNAEPRSPPSA